MKIVCLTEPSPGLRYTVNSLYARFGVALTVLESSKMRIFTQDLKRFGARETLYRTRLVGKRLLGLGSAARVNSEVFGSSSVPLHPEIPVLRVKDVNAEEVRAALARLQPDIVVCQGTTIVKSQTLAGVAHALNIHAGLSPYYRGSRCTEWALALGDVRNIGVTVHKLAPNVDGGGIVGQARLEIFPDDDVERINARLLARGTEIVCDVVEKLHSGAALTFHPQPPELGLHVRRRQWSRFLDLHVKHLLARGELPRMIANPSADPQPLIAPWPPRCLDPQPSAAYEGLEATCLSPERI